MDLQNACQTSAVQAAISVQLSSDWNTDTAREKRHREKICSTRRYLKYICYLCVLTAADEDSRILV